MYFGLKQGQITPNIENKYILKLIHLAAKCSKITNTVLFLNCILYHFSAFCCFVLVMSECPKVHFVALRFISFLLQNVRHPERNEPPHGKTNNLHRRKQRRRSASQLLRS